MLLVCVVPAQAAAKARTPRARAARRSAPSRLRGCCAAVAAPMGLECAAATLGLVVGLLVVVLVGAVIFKYILGAHD